MLHKCGISPRRKCFNRGAQPLRVLWTYNIVCLCVCVVLCKLVCLAVSLHLSHDFPDLGSPGVSHLGHQLHLQVNCSSKWSAKQCRKKKNHHRAHITSAWQDRPQKAGNKQANEWCERFAGALKMDEGCVKKQRNRNQLYIYLHELCLYESSSDCSQLFFFSSKPISCQGNSLARAN